ncbi:SCO3870 family protein [Streptomyces seoulensis]
MYVTSVPTVVTWVRDGRPHAN